MNKKRFTIYGTGVGITAAALTYYLWCHRHNLKDRAIAWKNEKIRDAYYDSLTEKDIAWG